MRRGAKFAIGMALGAAVLGFAIFLGFGAVKTSQFLSQTLTVGAPTAQGEGGGWPAPEGPTDIGYRGDPGAAFGFPFEEVAIETDLGAMPAWLVEPEGGVTQGARWAIFVHGIGGRRENGYRFLPTLRDAGMPVLMIAYRNDEGALPSTEGLYAFGLSEWQDLDAAVRFADGAGAGPILLVAESMGGAIVGQFLRRSDQASRVDAIALDAPALDLPGLVANNIAGAGVPMSGLVARAGLRLFGWERGLDFASTRTIDELADFPGPVFLSHGARDRLVPVSVSDELADARTGRIDYLRTEADHIQSYKENPERHDTALRAFIAKLPQR